MICLNIVVLLLMDKLIKKTKLYVHVYLKKKKGKYYIYGLLSKPIKAMLGDTAHKTH